MKTLISLCLLLSLAACEQVTSNCGQYKDEASCVAVSACHWNKNEGVCKS